jgi:hypothetical protein
MAPYENAIPEIQFEAKIEDSIKWLITERMCIFLKIWKKYLKRTLLWILYSNLRYSPVHG